MPTSHFLQFIGGLAFFFFGLYTVHQGLIYFAGDRLKSIVAKTTRSRLHSLGTGIIVTFFLQSSSAVTAMAVGFTASGLIALEQAMALSLGAGIGTTIVVFLISLKRILEYGVLILAFGLVLKILSSRKLFKIFGEILFGFGFVFVGMLVMSQSTIPLKNDPWIPQIFQILELYPFINLVIAAVVTALVHSSGVVLGILISLAFSNAMTFEAALPLIMGANVGTAFTAIAVSMRSNTEGKRAAWSNLLLRLGAVMLIYPVLSGLEPMMRFLNRLILVGFFRADLSLHTEIALAHFYFNIFLAMLFFPFLPLGSRFVCWLFPKQEGEDLEFGPKYLDMAALETPTLAFAQASRELLRLGEIIQTMFKDSLKLFERYDLDLVDSIMERDHKVDKLYKAIKFYLARLSFQNLKEDETEKQIQLVSTVNEMENIGDTIDRHIGRLAHKKWQKGIRFSNEGWNELREMHEGTAQMLVLALAAMTTQDGELARRLERHYELYNDKVDGLKHSHLTRLNQGLQESIDTSSIHLELLSLYHRINWNLFNMVSHLLPDEESVGE